MSPTHAGADSKALLALNYIQSLQPGQAAAGCFVRYFDAVTSVVAAVGGVGSRGPGRCRLKVDPAGRVGYTFTKASATISSTAGIADGQVHRRRAC
jgi:hypothetical protein